jgi:TolA-binding protein
MWQNAQVAVMSNDDANVNSRLNKAVELGRNNRVSRGQTSVPGFYENQAKQQQDFIAGNTAGLASQRPVNQYLQAENYMRQGQLQKAQDNLERIASQYPQAKLAAAAAFGLAECRRRAGNLTEAMKLYAEFLEKYQESDLVPKARFILAELKRLAGLDAEARELYVKVRQQLNEMSREILPSKGPPVIVRKELPSDLQHCLEVTEARLKEMAVEQQKQIGK